MRPFPNLLQVPVRWKEDGWIDVIANDLELGSAHEGLGFDLLATVRFNQYAFRHVSDLGFLEYGEIALVQIKYDAVDVAVAFSRI